MITLPSGSDLIYFLEVSGTLNISRAAERLGISQPSLSMAIRRLEDIIGVSLLIRHKHGVSLTQAGKQLALHARQLLQYWENTRSQALASQNKVQGYCTIGCNPIIATYFLSGVLKDVLEVNPALEIHLKHDISRKITEEVINLSTQLGIVVNPSRHPDLIVKKLFDDQFTFWTSTKPTASQDPDSRDAILVCDPALHQTQILMKQARDSGMKSRRTLTTSSLEVVGELTAAGCGIGILPACFAETLYAGRLVQLKDAPVFSDEVCLICRHENRQVQAVQAIMDAITASAVARKDRSPMQSGLPGG